MTFIDEIVNDMTDRWKGVVVEMENLVQQNTGDVLLRRFRQGYDKLSVEDILAVQGALGHQIAESKPCKVCQIMAAKEFELG